jgi:translocation and assembly module TamA
LVYGVEFSNEYGPVFDNFTNAAGLAADVRDRNVFGRGWSASAGGRYEPNLRSARALFGIPSIGTLPVRTSLFAAIRDEEAYASDEGSIFELVRSASIEQRWRPWSWLDLSWGYAITGRDLTFRLTRGIEDFQTLGVLASLNATAVIDRRDNLMNTRRGWFHSSSWQQGLRAIGSDFTYTRYLGRAFGFLPLGRRVVLATGVRYGAIWNTAGDVPIDALDLLFKAGGSQTVRGYAQDALSAADFEGLPLGGDRLVILNQELRVSISKWLQAAVFADAGNTFVDRVTVSDLAVGIGGGFRVITPLAPLRVDLAFPIPRRHGDRRYRLHFSVGHAF